MKNVLKESVYLGYALHLLDSARVCVNLNSFYKYQKPVDTTLKKKKILGLSKVLEKFEVPVTKKLLVRKSG